MKLWTMWNSENSHVEKHDDPDSAEAVAVGHPFAGRNEAHKPPEIMVFPKSSSVVENHVVWFCLILFGSPKNCCWYLVAHEIYVLVYVV